MTASVRLLEVDDLLAAALRGEQAMPLRVAEGFPRPEDAEALRAYDRGALSFLIVADGVVVGSCGTHGPPSVERIVELGWGLVAVARGRGVGSTAVRLLLDEVTRRFPSTSVVAHTEWSAAGDGLAADSVASEAILGRLGFAPDPAPTEPGYRAWRRAAP